MKTLFTTNLTLSLISFALTLLCVSHAGGIEVDEIGGSLKATVEGKEVSFPALKTDIIGAIEGDIASITVTQIFSNPTNTPLNATYLFPLNKDAAVYGMTMEVGDELIEAEIQETTRATRTFAKAKREGKAAVLLKQHRPNMFTQNVANLMPQMPITVTLRYTQTVPKLDGNYELVIPLIVGPRYQPAGTGIPATTMENTSTDDEPNDTSFGTWELEQLPHYPPVAGLSLPKTIEKERVSLKLTLHSGTPISAIRSETHPLLIEGNNTTKKVSFMQGQVLDNRDLVIRYRLSGKRTNGGMLTTNYGDNQFFSLLLEPPVVPEEEDITAREMVFLLDTSGSMGGAPMDASKTFMTHALQSLRTTDYFRIIRFSNHASEYSTTPVAATKSNVSDALQYVSSLHAGGGTEVLSGMRQAFQVPPTENTLRTVVFLTDGYIGNEASVLQFIASNIQEARIYSFGVGTSVNRYLLGEMSRVGHGFSRIIDPTENFEDEAIAFARKLESPVLTDISIDWGNMGVKSVSPTILPDLFAGDSLRIQGQFTGSTDHITITGKVRGQKATLPIKVISGTPPSTTLRSAIPLIWARMQIQDRMRLIKTPGRLRPMGISDSVLKQEVIALGLTYSLATKWTSFVAVSKKIVNEQPELAVDKDVPLPMVKGVTAKAYPSNFSGHSVPEPGTMGGLFLMGGAGLAALRRRKKKQEVAV